MNLSPFGEPDISPDALSELDLVLGSFHSARFVVPKIKLSVIWRHCATKTSIFSLILKAEFSIIERVCVQIGIVSLLRLRGLIKLSRLMVMPIARISN